MEMFLEDIKCIPGVSCVLCFDTSAGIVAKISAGTFSDEALSGVSRTLAKILSGGKQLFADMQSVQLRFDRLSILIVSVIGTHYLTIIHEQTLNTSLLSMTMVQTIKNLMAALSAPTSVPPHHDSGSGRVKIQQTIGTGPYAQAFNMMETSLAKVMGPMASIVFQEAFGKWMGMIEDPNKIPLEMLVKMLATEIGDPEKVKTYELLIAPCIKAR